MSKRHWTNKFRRITATLALATATIGVPVIAARPAAASTGGYPFYNEPCEHSPYATSGSGYWCADYDWGPKHTEAYNDPSEISTYGYAYRNCTDYVAWKLASLGVPSAQYRGLGNAADWPVNAPNNNLVANGSPATGAVAVDAHSTFGHVAFIENYDAATGVMDVSEYNHGQDGNYGTRSGTAAQLGFSKFVHFEPYENNSSGSGSSGGAAPSLVGDIVATNQANGLEEVFYVGGNNAIWYRMQNTDGSWSAEHTLAAGAKAITAARTADGRIELFYVGGDNAIWYRWQTAPNTDSWSAEHRVSAGASQVTAIAEPDGRIGVFYIGGDGSIWYRWQNTDGTWSAEEHLPSGVKALSATITADGRIELLYVGGNNAIWYRAQTAPNTDSWTAESTLPAGAQAITATDQANGLEEVFYVGGDNSIWYRWRNADKSWSSEHTLHAGAHAITSTDTPDGRIQLFYVGGDNSVWTRWQTAPNTDTWSAESKLGGGVG